MPPRRNPQRDTAMNKGVTTSSRASSDTDESESFKDFIRRKLIEISFGQASLESHLSEATEYSSKNIADLQSTTSDHEKQMKDMKAEINLLQEKLDKLGLDINKNERFARRNNFRLVGVPKQEGENCMEIVADMLRDKFGWSQERIKIEPFDT